MIERAARVEQFLKRSFATLAGRLIILYLATLGWLLLWAWYDYAVVGLAFRPLSCATCPRPDYQLYWNATWYVLFPIVTLLIFRRHAWLPILALWLGGWEDILFFWIQGLPVPPVTSWILLAPTREILYLKATLFLLASIVIEILYFRREAKLRSGSKESEPEE